MLTTLFTLLTLFFQSAKGMTAKLNYAKTRTKQHDHHIEDIYDGARYRKLQQHGWFESIHDYALLIGLDGVSLFKQSHTQAWPIWGILCNLPPNERYFSEFGSYVCVTYHLQV